MYTVLYLCDVQAGRTSDPTSRQWKLQIL